MRHKILTISLAAILALGPWVTALAADEQNSATVVNHGRWVGMSVSPNSWDIGIPEAESTYTDSFTLANTGNAPLDMYVKGNAATNGENIWTLDASGQYGESTYGLKYYISGEESKAALGSGLGALTEGLSGAHSQEFNLDLLTPTTAVDPNQPVSTSIDLYAIKNPESQDLSGDKENPIPYGEFAQYPSEISIQGPPQGNLSHSRTSTYAMTRTRRRRFTYQHTLPKTTCAVKDIAVSHQTGSRSSLTAAKSIQSPCQQTINSKCRFG